MGAGPGRGPAAAVAAALHDLHDRLDNARWKLSELETGTPASAWERKTRLRGKIEGVELAISYLVDTLRAPPG